MRSVDDGENGNNDDGDVDRAEEAEREAVDGIDAMLMGDCFWGMILRQQSSIPPS